MELIDGIAYNMTPAPSTRHQTLVLRMVSVSLTKHSREVHAVASLPPRMSFCPSMMWCSPTSWCATERRSPKPTSRALPTSSSKSFPLPLVSRTSGKKGPSTKNTVLREYILVDPFLKCVECLVLGSDGAYGKAEVLGASETLEDRMPPGHLHPAPGNIRGMKAPSPSSR